MTSHDPSPPTMINDLTMPGGKPKNSKLQNQASLTPSVIGPKRRRPHTAAAWAKIRPAIEHLYIDMDMTLRDVIQTIDKEHGFRATEQMYKKRLKAWGVSKHVKADEKEKALVNLLHKEPTATELSQVRHDKLVRYAKSRVKSGTLDSHGLTMVMDLARHHKHGRLKVQPVFLRHTVATVSRHLTTPLASTPSSLALPDVLSDFDLFLRAMHSVIEKEREEWLSGQQLASDGVFRELTEGLAYWRANAHAAACRSFGQAAQKMAEDIQGPVVLVSRIAYCISSIVWGFNREPIFLKFAHFMAKAAVEKLGKDYPITIVLKHLQRELSLEAQLAIWACALDDYQISERNVDHWWNMAQRRWRWCQRSGRTDLATRYCSHAMGEVHRISRLTTEMESEAQHDLDSMERGTRS